MIHDIRTTTVELERLRFASQLPLGETTKQSMELEVLAGLYGDQLYMALTAEVLGQNRRESTTVVFEQPASWWQHTKARHLPTFSRWLRRPPRYERIERTVAFTEFALFPYADVAIPPELGPVVRFAVLEEPRL